jgi:alpha-glucosidase
VSHAGKNHWWQSAVIYEIYTRSFMDADGDGVGDLPGIRSRLGYLQWLGIDTVWLTPFYPSPMCDWGYDVADYTAVDPTYGTLADFDALLGDMHARGMRLIIDLVPNHTSDQHPWFQESRSSRTNPKRDWYIWRDPAPGGGPPNNWLSTFGGSAWKHDDATGQYYYHAFLEAQPDLNWRNADLRDAMHAMMRFWLDRGVDGFRVDAVDYLLEDEILRPDPPNPRYTPKMPPSKVLSPVYSMNRPETRELFGELGDVAREYGERVLVGEVHVPVGQLASYYGSKDEFDLPFNFALMTTPWRSADLREAIDSYLSRLTTDEWPNWVLGNHDAQRVASRVGQPQARVAALLLLTLRGTPTIYYGDELGMTDVPIPAEQTKDPLERRVPGHGLGRDGARTPMLWDDAHAAGFTRGDPWLPTGDDVAKRCVARQQPEPRSLLNLYRRLIALRRSEPAFLDGEYAPIDLADGLVGFIRTFERANYLVVANIQPRPATAPLPADHPEGRIILSTELDREEMIRDTLTLRADEGVVIEVKR